MEALRKFNSMEVNLAQVFCIGSRRGTNLNSIARMGSLEMLVLEMPMLSAPRCVQ